MLHSTAIFRAPIDAAAPGRSASVPCTKITLRSLHQDLSMRHRPLLSFALFLLALAIAAPILAADMPERVPSPTLDRIKRTGTITFAYREGAPPFSFKS